MFFLGIIGILQVLFIPGLIVLPMIKLRIRPMAYFIGVVSCSLVINYCLVFLLTVFHLYLRFSLFIVIAFEIVLIIWQNRKVLDKPIEYWIEKIRRSILVSFKKWAVYFQNINGSSSLIIIIKIIYIIACLILAYISLNWIWKLFTWNIGSVFNSYDTIASWNKWALDWANNSLPGRTLYYPQLLPVNWSIIYLLLGDSSIQLFAQAIMPLFTLFILLILVDLGFAKKNAGFFIGSFITYLMLKKFLGPFVVEGLADIPSAFFALGAIYFLLLSQAEGSSFVYKKEYSIFIAICSAGCAVTKQTGLLFIFLFSIVYFLFFIKPLFVKNSAKIIKILFPAFLIIIIIVVPWYLYKQVMIWNGFEPFEIQGIVGTTAITYDALRISNLITEISKLLGKYLFLFILLIPSSFFLEPIIGAINFFVIIPFFISWGIFASYDFRNLSIALPIFGLCSGLSLNLLIEYCFNIFKKISFEKMHLKYILILVIILIIIGGTFFLPDDFLRKKQIDQVMNTFSPSINQKLITYLGKEKNDFTIMTPYPLDNLPGMKGKKIGVLFDSFADYQLSVERVSKTVELYFLIPKYSDQQIMEDINNKLETGDYVLIFEDDSWNKYLFIKDVVR
jgi:hypothetical protein